MKQISLIFAVLTAMLLVSCNQTDNGKVEYIPFQETSDGQWGMISLDGKVLFTEEFKTKPTVVRDGRFFVRTQEGAWEMYDATEKPKKIGVDYAHTSGFRNGVALVAEKGKPVSIIDTDGKTKKVLDKIDGKVVDGVRNFEEGYAVFMTTDSLYGVIDQSGDCVIKPEYCSLNNCSDGKFIGVNQKYQKDVKADKKDKVKIAVLNTSGKIVYEFNGGKYDDTAYGYTDGLLPVSVKKDAKVTWGIVNDKGEIVVKASSKIKNIGTIHGDKFTYNNGEGWGLMDIKGQTLIRAKYEFLYYDDDNTLVAVVKDGESYVHKYIDEKDNQLGDETYVKATLYSMFDGQHAIVKPNDKIYSIIDKNGKQIEGLPDIVNVGTYEGEYYIESDYVDIPKMLAGFNITPDGIIGVTTKTTPKEAVAMHAKLGLAVGDKDHPAGTPYWYDYRDNLDLYKDVDGVRGYVRVSFSGNLSKQTYRTQRVIDYDFGDWYYYHDNKIPTGYVWNKVNPTAFMLMIGNNGRMHGKLRDLYKVVYAKFKGLGTIVKENNSAAVINLKSGGRAFVAMKKDNVFVFWGTSLKDAKDIDIEEYKDATEEDDPSIVSYGYLNSLFPDEAVADTAAVDTVAVE